MEWMQIVLLMSAGLAAGFVAGLIGVGGGIIFAPVLFFYFQHTGVAPDVMSELTIGSSLLCTLLAALASASYQYRERAVRPRVAVSVGCLSAAAVYLTTRYVTTTAWYDAEVFQVVFSTVLMAVVARMVLGRKQEEPSPRGEEGRPRWTLLAGTGTAAGAVAAAAGVGGGIVLVPAYNRFLHLPIHQAVGTSSATIVIISLAGIASYVLAGWGAAVLPTAVGYVDLRALFLAVPALLSARAGVWTAHRFNTRALRWSFATVALFVAGRMIYDALG